MRTGFRLAVVVTFCLVAILFLFKYDYSGWVPTSSGGVRTDAFDFIEGKIDIINAYNQNGVCKNYSNDLDDSDTGISGAVADPAQFAQLNYYYYKTNSYVQFYRNGQVEFTLTLYNSPAYFKQPRIVPNKTTLLSNLQNLSIGQQVQIANALVDPQGNPKQFTAQELATLLQSIVGPQSFDLKQWVIQNLFDQNEQTFMSCVPNIDKLTENPYGPDQATAVTTELTGDEKQVQIILDKASENVLSTFLDSL